MGGGRGGAEGWGGDALEAEGREFEDDAKAAINAPKTNVRVEEVKGRRRAGAGEGSMLGLEKCWLSILRYRGILSNTD